MNTSICAFYRAPAENLFVPHSNPLHDESWNNYQDIMDLIVSQYHNQIQSSAFPKLVYITR
jgi:hypothetical protein